MPLDESQVATILESLNQTVTHVGKQGDLFGQLVEHVGTLQARVNKLQDRLVEFEDWAEAGARRIQSLEAVLGAYAHAKGDDELLARILEVEQLRQANMDSNPPDTPKGPDAPFIVQGSNRPN